MLRTNGTTLRKGGVALALAVAVGLLLASGDAVAKNKKSNPSPKGAANGVAHRVAALEAAVGELQDAEDDTLERIEALESFAAEAVDRIVALEQQVADLEARVAALETPVAPLNARR